MSPAIREPDGVEDRRDAMAETPDFHFFALILTDANQPNNELVPFFPDYQQKLQIHFKENKWTVIFSVEVCWVLW